LDTIIEKIENSEALIKIKLKEDDYQDRLAQKIKEYSKKVTIKGFRPGKVPTGLVKQLYGTALLVEEINKIVSDEVNKTLKTSELQFLGEPMPSDAQSSINWENQKDFEFVFSIGYTDEFELAIDKKLKIDYHTIKVDEKVVNETIENLQKQYGEETTPEIIENGDTVYGSIKSADGLITQEVSIDLNEMEKSIIKKLISNKIGFSIDLDVTKSFNHKHYFERVSRLTEDEIKQTKGKFNFTISGIVRVKLAEINQDFFDKIIGKESVKSLDEFKSKVKETVSKTYVKEAENYFFYLLRKKLIDVAKINLPDQFLKKWLLETSEQLTEANIEKEYSAYADEMRWSLIRNKVTKMGDLKVEHEEILQQTKEMIAAQFGGGAIIEQLGSQMDVFADNYLKGEKGNNYMKVYNQVLNQKVFKYVHDSITAKEKEITLDEFRNLD